MAAPVAGPEAEEYDLYDALNLQRNASADEVRSAFRDLSRVYHPDKQRSGAAAAEGGSGTGSAAESAFMRVHRAYRVLGDDVLRSFYDRYGLSGVRLAESLSDDEDEPSGRGGAGGQVCLPEDRLKDLEGRVRVLMRRREELRTQRLLALQGTFTLAAVAGPGHHGAHLRRRYRLQYCATSHTVQIAVCDRLKLTVGCASHVQGANGVGAAKLMVSASSQLDSQTTARAAVNVTGTAPEMDVSLVRSLNEHCTVQQRASCSSDGCTMSFSVYPWLSRTLRGNLGVSLGEGPNVTLGLLKRSSTSGHSARAFLNLHPGAGELGAQLKYKPSRDFSVKLAPSISHRGWALQATCTKAADGGLTKLHWALRVRRMGVQVRFTLCRSGLRFAIPLELWPESAGPIPAGELALLVAVWAAPPFVLRMLFLLGRSLREALQSSGVAARLGSGVAAASEAASANAASTATTEADAAEAAEAREQRRLVVREAARCRSQEVAARGLEIVSARYGDPELVANASTEAAAQGIIDVTDCLMAKVRYSRLHISDAPKSTLLGFCNPSQGAEPRALHIRYRFGGVEYERTFGDTELVVLP